MDDSKTEEPKPPYLPFTTFLGFLNELAAKPLPPQIDRSMMSSKSGTDQANLFAALKFFDLIDGANVVQPGLKTLTVADEAGRKRTIATFLRHRYPLQFEVSEQNGSEKMLLDSIERDFGYTGDTRRKAMTFFLHAARWAGMDLSAHFPTTRMGSGRPAASRAKRTTKKRATTGDTGTKVQTHERPDSEGELVYVSFGPAGSVRVDVKVRWLELPDETFSDLRRIIKELRALGVEVSEGPEEESREAEVSTS